MIEVSELTRGGTAVRTARFMASRVIALVEHPAPRRAGAADERAGRAAAPGERAGRAAAGERAIAADRERPARREAV
jgi:hypothetical protein